MKAPLTHRERQAINGALRGLTLAEIGRRLFLSPKTVCTYRTRALDKLGVRTARQLPRWYMARLVERYGLLVPPPALLEPSVAYLEEPERMAA